MSDAPDDVLLPSAEEREAVLDALAGLVTRCGYEHIALAPLVEPDDRHFPDRWGGGEASVRRVAARLLIYADLEALVPVVEVEDDVGLGPMAQVGIGSAAWFHKLDRTGGATRPVFRVRESSLRDPFVLVPAMARAVAAAWRAHHRLAVADPGAEERFVDLTAIYLGFGLLTLPAAVRHQATRQGSRVRATVSKSGVLDPRTLSFALAVVLAIRGTDAKARKAIGARVGDNATAFIKAADAWFAAMEPAAGSASASASALHDRIGVPARATWAEPPSLSLLAGPLDASLLADDPAASQEIRRDEEKGVVGMNAGKPVFRVERSKALRLAKLLGLPVLLLGMLFGRAQMGIEIEMWKAALAAGALALVGLAIGRMLPDARCSEPRCGESLPPDATTCPRCGGRIAGVIHHPRERLAAEDALSRADNADTANVPAAANNPAHNHSEPT
jgi:hypothetical protein